MGRPIMAINAVHPAQRCFGDLLGFEPTFFDFKDCDLAIPVGHPDPGNHLAPFIRCDVLGLIGHIHVPVDAAHRAVRRVAPAHF